MAVTEVLLSGYTPYPRQQSSDNRLPHEAAKLHKQIQKTALGAELTQKWRHVDDLESTVAELRQQGYTIAAIEQAVDSLALPAFSPPAKIALLVGREVEGVETEVLAMMDVTLEIPMYGSKESFNVVQAAAMGLYHCRFHTAN